MWCDAVTKNTRRRDFGGPRESMALDEHGCDRNLGQARNGPLWGSVSRGPHFRVGFHHLRILHLANF